MKYRTTAPPPVPRRTVGGTVNPDPILADVDATTLASGTSLLRWLAHHEKIRPTLLAVDHERRRRGVTPRMRGSQTTRPRPADGTTEEGNR